MRIISTIVALTVAASAAAPAFAQTDRLTDVEYLQAARCAGLAASDTLGAMDTAAIDSLLKAQSSGRAGFILDKAQGVKNDTRRMANRAKAERRAGYIAERDGVCARYLG